MSRWTNTQDQILIRGIKNNLTAREISENLNGKAIIAVRRRAVRLGLKFSRQNSESQPND